MVRGYGRGSPSPNPNPKPNPDPNPNPNLNPNLNPNPNPGPHQVSSRRVFFTLNGAYLGPAFTAKAQQLPLYPVVGIDSYSPVKFNFGAEPFAFDVAEVPAALHATTRRLRVSRCFGSA